MASTFVGTVLWMAPELIVPDEDSSEVVYDQKVDIWALGITAIELVTGRVPHMEVYANCDGKKSTTECLRLIATSPAPELQETHLWSRPFRDWVSRCLTKNAAQRPTAEELLTHPFLLQQDGLDSNSDTDRNRLRRLARHY